MVRHRSKYKKHDVFKDEVTGNVIQLIREANKFGYWVCRTSRIRQNISEGTIARYYKKMIVVKQL